MTQQLDMFPLGELPANYLKTPVATCINTILKKDIEEPYVIVPDLLVSGEATMYAALAGGAKTYTMQYLAACVATGSSFLGMPAAKPLRVVIVDGELSEIQIQQRFSKLFNYLGVHPQDGFLTIIHKKSYPNGLPDLSKPEGYEEIRPELELADAVFLDNLSALYRDDEELIQNDWNYYNSSLDELRNAGKAVFVLHHTDKASTNYRGHSEIARAIDNAFIAVKDNKQSNDFKTVIRVKRPKSRNGAAGEEFLKFEFGSDSVTGEFFFQKLI
ncbi:AAA family ATPase [Psychrosphaera sp. F3M07]|uniref:AAA family ATPase n=1 Tax=Psychrosphaera sp. F3M07 TaxID=2841560 RepID=UPI001C0A3E59|nr:AAA family ATPase [Psychrosphaera sp. F3M07]MBU2918070.1 AAA family ATPase [Psychrosphaera sp. F3M07]